LRLWQVRQQLLLCITTQVVLYRIRFYAAWLATCPGFAGANRSHMRHKMAALLQPFEVTQ
jgi:hypothetical protein